MSFEEEMSRFEAEIRRTQSGMAAAALAANSNSNPAGQFRTNPGGFVPSQVRAASLNPHTSIFSSAAPPPPVAPSAAAPTVISAPPQQQDNGGEEEDVFAKLAQYEAEHKKEKKLHKKKKKEKKAEKSAVRGAATTAATATPAATATATSFVPPPNLSVPPPANPSTLASATTTTFTPVPAGVKNTPVSATIGDEAIKKAKQRKRMIRTGGGQIWEDDSLKEWDPSDFRLFAGDLGNDVTDEVLARTFGRYPSFQKAKVIRDKRTNKTKGYGFVSFKDPTDFTKAVKELNGKYVGSRPIKLRKSNWRERNIDVVRSKQKAKQQQGYKW